MHYPTDIAAALAREIKRIPEMNPTKLAEVSGVPQPTVQRILSGRHREPRPATLRKLATGLGLPSDYFLRNQLIDTGVYLEDSGRAQYLPQTSWETALATLEENAKFSSLDEEKFCFVPAYNLVRDSNGANDGYTKEPNSTRVFSREWVRDKALTPGRLLVLEAKGDSMAPYIQSGDAILVDTSPRPIVSGRVYAFRVEGDIEVKRVHRNINGTFSLSSDNKSDPSQREEVLHPQDLETVDLLGLVVWRAG